MPWTAKDAHSKKKGLTDAQARKWAKIANAALERCRKEGGLFSTERSGEDCEARAIMIASSRVK